VAEPENDQRVAGGQLAIEDQQDAEDAGDISLSSGDLAAEATSINSDDLLAFREYVMRKMGLL